jgi:hypothetical protein
MKLFEQNKIRLLWFLGGFGTGLTVVTLSHAALPTRATPTLLREIKGGKISSPEFESDLAELNQLEQKYVESHEQQERLKGRSSRVAAPSTRTKKKGIR